MSNVTENKVLILHVQSTTEYFWDSRILSNHPQAILAATLTAPELGLHTHMVRPGFLTGATPCFP